MLGFSNFDRDEVLIFMTLSGKRFLLGFHIIQLNNLIIFSHEGTDTPANSSDIKVLLSSFKSNVVKLRVQKKADKVNMDLLTEDEPTSGIWNSITRY